MTDTISLSDALEPGDVDAAVAELSARFGWGYSETWQNIRERAQGQRDTASLAVALSALYTDALDEGQQPGQGTLALTDYSQEERDQLASEGKALASGAYPIKTEEDAKNAAVLIKSGHGDVAAATRLLAKRCREEGWPNPLDEDGDEDQDVAASAVAGTFGWAGSDEIALSAGSYPAEPAAEWTFDAAAEAAAAAEPEVVRLTATHSRFFDPGDVAQARGYLALGTTDELTGDSDYGTVEAAHVGSEVERLSMANDERNGKGKLRKGISKIHNSDSGHPHGKGHHRGCAPGCSTDHRAPHHGGVIHPEVARYLDMAASKMGNAEKPHGNSTVHKPGRY